MKALVTGGAGFIGSHLCEALINDGHYVICVDNFSLGTNQNIGQLLNNENFKSYEVDVLDKERLEQVFQKEMPEYIFHLAANSNIQASALNPDVEYRDTYTTTFRVLSAMCLYNVKKIFFASSSAVYGDKGKNLLDEDTSNLSPISYYGAAKLGSEALINAFSYMSDITALIFRFPNVVGPRLTHGVVFDFVHKLQRDPTRLEILGNGKQTKPYIFVSDLIDAIMMFKDSVKSGVMYYNVGSVGETSVNRIADIICEEMNLKSVQYCYTGGNCGWKGDVPQFYYCLDKIHKAGWHAKYTSDMAIKKAVCKYILAGNV